MHIHYYYLDCLKSSQELQRSIPKALTLFQEAWKKFTIDGQKQKCPTISEKFFYLA